MDVTSVCWTLLAACLFSIVSAVLEQKIITMKPGQDITLTCEAPNNNNIIIVEWSRADLKEDEYVLLYRDGRFLPDDQHPSFKNRVDLQDRQMKDGDVSVILKDVTINDTGTYECRVMTKKENNMKLISSIYLHVDPPGQTGEHTEDGSVGLIVGLVIFAVLLVGGVVFLIYPKKCNQIPYQAPLELQSV